MEGKIAYGKEQNHGESPSKKKSWREKLSINTNHKGKCEQKQLSEI